ncbi:hypothetical protein SMICM304S_07479 [Streptomyces microflavus]
MMPSVDAAFALALARICGCHRAFTSPSRRAARSGRGFLIWSFTYRSTVRWDTRSICATAFVPPSCFTRYRICAPALFGAGRVNAFCTALFRPSPIRLMPVFSYSPLSASVTLPSLMNRAKFSCGASNCSRTPSPQSTLWVPSCLTRPGLMPSLNPPGSGLPSR